MLHNYQVVSLSNSRFAKFANLWQHHVTRPINPLRFLIIQTFAVGFYITLRFQQTLSILKLKHLGEAMY